MSMSGMSDELFSCFDRSTDAHLDTRASPTATRVVVTGTGRTIYTNGNVTWTVSGLYARGCSLLFRADTGFTGTANLVNADSDIWTTSWASAATTGKLYRQYTIDIHVTDKDNDNLANATVTLKDKDGNTVFSVLTGAEGMITQQTVSRSYYDQPHGDVLQDYSPHTLTIDRSTWFRTYHTFQACTFQHAFFHFYFTLCSSGMSLHHCPFNSSGRQCVVNPSNYRFD